MFVELCTALVAVLPAHAQGSLRTLHGELPGDEYGYSVAGAGDLDGDRVPDLLVGARFFDELFPRVGKVYAISGADGSEFGSASGFFGMTVGWAVAAAGDVDGDGLGDSIVGVPGDIANGTNSGAAWVFSGTDFSAPHHVLSLSVAGDRCGSSVDGAGDVDGDGYDDLIVGSPNAAGSGYRNGVVHVFSGRDGSMIHALSGPNPGDLFGHAVTGTGDVDGDGFDDFAVGILQSDAGGENAGSVHVFSGADASILFTMHGDSDRDQLGASLDGGADVDGDGVPDLVAGAPFGDALGPDSGYARVFSGATGTVIHTLTLSASADKFGRSVALAGDVDGDCLADVVVGAHLSDQDGPSSGLAAVYSGATGAHLHTFLGANGTNFGWSVGCAGDTDGDGFDEIVVGAPSFDESRGQVRTFHLGVSGTPPRHTIHDFGCAGGLGRLPRIGYRGHARIDSTWIPTLRAAAPNSTTTLLVGDPSAVPLDVLGMAGCNLWVAPFATFATPTDEVGIAEFPLEIVDTAFFVGQSMTCQWLTIDPSAPYTLTISASDAVTFFVGG